MTIEVPDWCKIGKEIECEIWNYGSFVWVTDEIVAYTECGFYHRGSSGNSKTHFSFFSDYGKTVRECEER